MVEQTKLVQPVALTMGDPAGIGPDITIAAWHLRHQNQLPHFLYIGDPDVLKQRAQMLGVDLPMSECQPQDAQDIYERGALPFYRIDCAEKVIAGSPSSANAEAIIGSISTAFTFCQEDLCSSIVTNPIAKSVLYQAGFSHPGHTEYLAHLARSEQGDVPLSVMMLAGPLLRTIPVTIHIPLDQVSTMLTTELIVETATIAASDLRIKFGIKQPRLAIAGLNPHAGENGTMGSEDDDIIKPAIEHLKTKGIDAFGPLPADTMFHEDARAHYDVALCMYHDQALIPAKVLGFHDAVNVTLGLPIIRTSPDHGTAFGIAGGRIARPDSFIAALKMADDMAQNMKRDQYGDN